jgi:hypothetical protein
MEKLASASTAISQRLKGKVGKREHCDQPEAQGKSWQARALRSARGSRARLDDSTCVPYTRRGGQSREKERKETRERLGGAEDETRGQRHTTHPHCQHLVKPSREQRVCFACLLRLLQQRDCLLHLHGCERHRKRGQGRAWVGVDGKPESVCVCRWRRKRKATQS